MHSILGPVALGSERGSAGGKTNVRTVETVADIAGYRHRMIRLLLVAWVTGGD